MTERSDDGMVRSSTGVARLTMGDVVERALSIPAQGTPLSRCPTNLDTRTLAGRAMLLKAMSPADIDIEPSVPVRIKAVAWAVVPDCQVKEDTGEVSEFTRTVFFDADGNTFRTSSAHGPSRLRAMLELFTRDEWERGIPLIISVKKGKRGHLYHEIEVDTEERFTTM